MIAAGINYVADLSDELDGPVIISMSLGGSSPSKLVEDAIDYAIKKGVIIVASVGNNGDAGMGWPGAYPQVISCAANGWTEMYCPTNPSGWWRNEVKDVPEILKITDCWGNEYQIFLAQFSSRPNKELGQKNSDLEITIPGVYIVGPYKPSIYWTGSAWVNPGPGFYYVSGTSMAAPHVSAIAALIFSTIMELEDEKDEKKKDKKGKHKDDWEKIDQKDMEKILKKAAKKGKVPKDGAWVTATSYVSWTRKTGVKASYKLTPL